MRLLRIEVSHFRQYKHQIIHFPQEGLIGVLGNNGAGKSTLFNAIGWCLYGKIKGVTNSMIKNQSAGKKDQCYVIIDFLFQGKHYRVRRDLVSSRCFAQVDAVVRAVGTTNLNAFIEEDVFKMDHSAFCTCYYAEQDDFDALVKLNPGPRVTTLSKLLRIETIDKAADSVRKDYRGLEVEVNESKKHMRDEHALLEEKQDFQQKILDHTKTISTLNEQISSLETIYKDQLVQKAEGEKDYREHQRLLNEKNQSLVQIDTLTNHSLQHDENRFEKLKSAKEMYEQEKHFLITLQQLEEEREKLSSLRSDYREKITVSEEIQTLKAEVQSRKHEIDELKNKLSVFTNVEETIDTHEKQLITLQQTIDDLTERIQEINALGNTKKEQFQDLKKKKKQLEDLEIGVPCPTCHQDLGSDHVEEEIKSIDREAKSLMEEAKTLQQEKGEKEKERQTKREAMEQLRVELSRLRNELLQKNKMNERYTLLLNEIGKRKEAYQALITRFEKVKDVVFDEERFNTITNELTTVKKKCDRLVRVEEALKEWEPLLTRIDETKRKIQDHKEMILSLEKEIEVLKFDEKAYSSLTSQIEQTQEHVQAKKDQRAHLQTDIKVYENDIKNIEEKMKENQQILAGIKGKEKQMILLAKLDEVYKAYKTDKLNKLVPALSSIMSDYIETITDGKYDQIELDDKYNISIYRKGIKNSLDFYSGGEKKLAALCQRLAISQLIVNQTGQANFDMLAMDEVFGAMDNERQDSIIEMLRNLNETFPQILIVAHNEHVKELFDYVLEIKQDKDGFSTFQWNMDWDEDEVREIAEEFDGDDEESEEEVS